MIEIEIDGKTLSAEPGETIIQVADKADIYIPRFCYHKKLSIAASCRMCLVDVDKAPKTLPACATPVASGMKVFTRSEKALQSQKSVMEFLLINHPLDCPVCDQGGECELQDLSLGYGKGISRFTEGKRAIDDENLGPLIATEMTRCIQCTRCVRFGDEIAGMRELGVMGRGEDLEIATYVGKAVHSELSGNMIDICPVGALTSKPYRFTARAWELQQHSAIAPHDCLGSTIYIHTRGEQYTSARHVMRVVPKENEAINETWISDRDRFSYEAIHSSERLLKPMVKMQGEWQEADWNTALSETANRVKAVIREHGVNEIGVFISPSATTEEAYLLQKLLRQMGGNNIDHRLRQTDFRGEDDVTAFPSLNFAISDLEKLTGLLLIGSNLRLEQPLANHRVGKAVRKGAKIMCVNPIDYDLNFSVDQKCIVGAAKFIDTLSKILKALLIRLPQEKLPSSLTTFLETIKPTEAEIKIANDLLMAENSAVILGAYAVSHPDYALIRVLSAHIAELAKARFGILSHGANSAGAWLAGAIPHRTAKTAVDTPGLNAHSMWERSLRAYILVGVEPELDSAYPALAEKRLEQAELVVSLFSFRSKRMMAYADVMLPMATFAETAGTYVNAEGTWQSMQAAILPLGDAKPGWKILCELADSLNLSGFDYTATESIRDELKNLLRSKIPSIKSAIIYPQQVKAATLYRVGDWPIYNVDSLVRRAHALQATMPEDTASIRVNAALAKKLNLQQGSAIIATQKENKITLSLIIDNRVADDQVWIPAGLDATAGFGEIGGEIQLNRL